MNGLIENLFSVVDPVSLITLCILFFVTFGFVIGRYNFSKRQAKEIYQKCTLGVWAEVLDVRKKVEHRTKSVKTKDGYKRKTYTDIFYIPTLKFEYNFETIEKECHTTNQSKNRYIVGEQVKIFIDPKNINNMRYEDISMEELLNRYKKKFISSLLGLFLIWGFIFFMLFSGI